VATSGGKTKQLEDPEVAIITAIYVANSNILTFKAKCCKIRDYLPHYWAYVFLPSGEEKMIQFDKLPVHCPLHPRVCQAVPNHTITLMPFCIDFLSYFLFVSVCYKKQQ
jgi:hypothetical protein